jgi:TldD protein
MYIFPKNLYTDIRIEQVVVTTIAYENYIMKQNKTKTENGAMIRMYDGKRWYYSSTTDINSIQDEIDKLERMASPDENIYDNPVVKRIEVNKGTYFKYDENDISKVSEEEKLELLNSYLPVLKEVPEIQMSTLTYLDNHTIKHTISSKGSNIKFDTQNGCIVASYTLFVNNLPQRSFENIYEVEFEKLSGQQNKLSEYIRKDLEYAKAAVPVTPGVYTCILSPVAAGVFAHESFGHKSEADFMIGDETMKNEWAIGSKVGAHILNIIDTGCLEGSGYVPYDDEGCKARVNYIIKDGILTGRLHSAYTAGVLNEEPTGNARAVNFEYEPIVRMTNTYIDKGIQSKEELFQGVKTGIYIDNIYHGSGMTTFTIAPSRAYMIRDGKLAEPVKISVITGNVMKTLNEIDGVSDTVELCSFGMGGCGKMEQFPLRVGYGGPYVRVNGINVQ